MSEETEGNDADPSRDPVIRLSAIGTLISTSIAAGTVIAKFALPVSLVTIAAFQAALLVAIVLVGAILAL